MRVASTEAAEEGPGIGEALGTATEEAELDTAEAGLEGPMSTVTATAGSCRQQEAHCRGGAYRRPCWDPYVFIINRPLKKRSWGFGVLGFWG